MRRQRTRLRLRVLRRVGVRAPTRAGHAREPPQHDRAVEQRADRACGDRGRDAGADDRIDPAQHDAERDRAAEQQGQAAQRSGRFVADRRQAPRWTRRRQQRAAESGDEAAEEHRADQRVRELLFGFGQRVVPVEPDQDDLRAESGEHRRDDDDRERERRTTQPAVRHAIGGQAHQCVLGPPATGEDEHEADDEGRRSHRCGCRERTSRTARTRLRCAARRAAHHLP